MAMKRLDLAEWHVAKTQQTTCETNQSSSRRQGSIPPAALRVTYCDELYRRRVAIRDT